MITEVVIYGFFNLASFICSLLPFFDVSFDTDFVNIFMDYVLTISYLLPMNTVIQIITIIVLIQTFKIGLAFIRILKQIVPFF